MSSLIVNEFTYDIVITSYNSEGTIRRAIKSAINQELPPQNIIVIDDCSQDGSAAIINELKSEFSIIKLITNSKNMGQSYSRNLGVKLSKSKYVMFLDDDDLSLPERSSQHAIMFRAGAQISFVSSNIIYGNGYSVICKNDNINVRKINSSEMLLYLVTGKSKSIFNRFFIPTSTCAVNVACFNNLGGFDILLRRLEDVDFAIRAAQENTFFSWTSDLGVNRFSSYGNDKGGDIDSKYEIMILNKFKDLISGQLFKQIIIYSNLRQIYFGKHYFQGLFYISTNPQSLIIILKKVTVLFLRIAHDMRRAN